MATHGRSATTSPRCSARKRDNRCGHYGLDEARDAFRFIAVIVAGGSASTDRFYEWVPTGVGKTSRGRSIARALGRKFVRMASAAFVRDEAEIRATGGLHRSMPAE